MNTPVRDPLLGWVIQNADGTQEPLAPAEQAEWDVLQKTLDERRMNELELGAG